MDPVTIGSVPAADPAPGGAGGGVTIEFGDKALSSTLAALVIAATGGGGGGAEATIAGGVSKSETFIGGWPRLFNTA